MVFGSTVGARFILGVFGDAEKEFKFLVASEATELVDRHFGVIVPGENVSIARYNGRIMKI